MPLRALPGRVRAARCPLPAGRGPPDQRISARARRRHGSPPGVVRACDCGAPGRDRTYDLGIRSPLLYPLSYERMSSDRLPPGAEDSLVGSQIDALRTAFIVVRHKRVPLVRRGFSQRVAARSRFGSFGLPLVGRSAQSSSRTCVSLSSSLVRPTSGAASSRPLVLAQAEVRRGAVRCLDAPPGPTPLRLVRRRSAWPDAASPGLRPPDLPGAAGPGPIPPDRSFWPQRRRVVGRDAGTVRCHDPPGGRTVRRAPGPGPGCACAGCRRPRRTRPRCPRPPSARTPRRPAPPRPVRRRPS